VVRWPWQAETEKVTASRVIVARAERLTDRLEQAVARLEQAIEQDGGDNGERDRRAGPSGIVR
jgi:hypothetical protein